jgi:D-alanine-D-alanine ligase-like ATP-grasp enzyme
MVLEHMGIRTAPFAVVPATSFDSIHEMNSMMADLSSTTLLANAMQFPLFIKPNSEGSSKGIYPFSKVCTMEQLEGGLRELHARYPDQSILVEPFLEGAEYTVSILGTGATAEVIGTAQQDWKSSTKEGIRDANYHAFWSQHEPDAEDDHPIRVVSSRKSLEVRQTEDLALQAWRALGCRDIGRVDIRWGRDGLPYVLEVCCCAGWCYGAEEQAANFTSRSRSTPSPGCGHRTRH